MKKISLLLALLLLAAALPACAGEGAAGDTTVPDETTATPETTEFSVTQPPEERSMLEDGFAFDEYLTLGDYRALSVTVPPQTEVTDAYLQNRIATELAAGGHFTRDDTRTTVAAGDVASLDFESMIDGEEYSGGSQNDFNIVVGVGGFIPALESALVGRTVGDSFSISAAYPDDYSVETLAGKTADFTVTVNHLSTLDPLTDALAAELSGDADMTAQRYTQKLRAQLEAAARVGYRTALYEALWNELSAVTEVKDVPVCDRLSYCEQIVAFYTTSAEKLGYTYADFLAAQDYTENSFLGYLYNDTSYDAVSQQLVLCAICAREGLPRSLPEERYSALLADYVLLAGYSSPAEMEADYGRYSLESMAFFNYVMDIVSRTAKIG